MEAKRLAELRKRLLLTREQILLAVRRSTVEARETAEATVQDFADKADSSYAKEMLFSLSGPEREMLRLVEEALDRIGSPGFGRCLECGAPMDARRLDALPWASHCLVCQERSEREKA
jgi:DnaK suppressor protein